MFESKERLAQDIQALLGRIQSLSEGRYACILDRRGIRHETPHNDAGEIVMLKRLLTDHAADVLTIPHALANEQPLADVFADWEGEELLLVFINEKAALIVVTPAAETLRDASGPLVRILADRLMRLEPGYAFDPRGRGFFIGHAKLDLIIIGRNEAGPA